MIRGGLSHWRSTIGRCDVLIACVVCEAYDTLHRGDAVGKVRLPVALSQGLFVPI